MRSYRRVTSTLIFIFFSSSTWARGIYVPEVESNGSLDFVKNEKGSGRIELSQIRASFRGKSYDVNDTTANRNIACVLAGKSKALRASEIQPFGINEHMAVNLKESGEVKDLEDANKTILKLECE